MWQDPQQELADRELSGPSEALDRRIERLAAAHAGAGVGAASPGSGRRRLGWSLAWAASVALAFVLGGVFGGGDAVEHADPSVAADAGVVKTQVVIVRDDLRAPRESLVLPAWQPSVTVQSGTRSGAAPAFVPPS